MKIFDIEIELWINYLNCFRKYKLCTNRPIMEHMWDKGWAFTAYYGGVYSVFYPIEIEQIRYDGITYNTKGNKGQCDMLMRNLQTVIALNELE